MYVSIQYTVVIVTWYSVSLYNFFLFNSIFSRLFPNDSLKYNPSTLMHRIVLLNGHTSVCWSPCMVMAAVWPRLWGVGLNSLSLPRAYSRGGAAQVKKPVFSLSRFLLLPDLWLQHPFPPALQETCLFSTFPALGVSGGWGWGWGEGCFVGVFCLF